MGSILLSGQNHIILWGLDACEKEKISRFDQDQSYARVYDTATLSTDSNKKSRPSFSRLEDSQHHVRCGTTMSSSGPWSIFRELASCSHQSFGLQINRSPLALVVLTLKDTIELLSRDVTSVYWSHSCRSNESTIFIDNEVHGTPHINLMMFGTDSYQRYSRGSYIWLAYNLRPIFISWRSLTNLT